jgi:hypothetical protein
MSTPLPSVYSPHGLADVLHDLPLGHALWKAIAEHLDPPAAQVCCQVYELLRARDHRLAHRRVRRFVPLPHGQAGHLDPGSLQQRADAPPFPGRGLQLQAVSLALFAAKLGAVKAVSRQQFEQVPQREIGTDRIRV